MAIIKTGRLPQTLATGFAMNNDSPMVRISHAVDCAKVLTLIPSSAAMSTKPGESIGPNAPTTAAERPTMRRIASFFQTDHYFDQHEVVNGAPETHVQWIIRGI